MTIVVGYRPTPEATAALEEALVQQRHLNASVLVVHSPEPHDGEIGTTPQRHGDPLSWLAGAHGTPEIRTLPPGSDPADAILRAAADTDADLIIIGLSRPRGPGSPTLGRTARRVLLEAECPVLGVKA